MRTLKVINLYDSNYPCSHEDNGCSGGEAEGARIELDGQTIAELKPIARCWDSTTFGQADIIQIVLEAFNILDVHVVSEEA